MVQSVTATLRGPSKQHRARSCTAATPGRKTTVSSPSQLRKFTNWLSTEVADKGGFKEKVPFGKSRKRDGLSRGTVERKCKELGLGYQSSEVKRILADAKAKCSASSPPTGSLSTASTASLASLATTPSDVKRQRLSHLHAKIGCVSKNVQAMKRKQCAIISASRPCAHFAKGCCRYGDDCFWSHAGKTGAAAEEPAAKASISEAGGPESRHHAEKPSVAAAASKESLAEAVGVDMRQQEPASKAFKASATGAEMRQHEPAASLSKVEASGAEMSVD